MSTTQPPTRLHEAGSKAPSAAQQCSPRAPARPWSFPAPCRGRAAPQNWALAPGSHTASHRCKLGLRSAVQLGGEKLLCSRKTCERNSSTFLGGDVICEVKLCSQEL